MFYNVSTKLEQLRKKHNFSQEKLAFLVGVSRQTIYKWEAAICLPNYKNIFKLLKIYNVEFLDLFIKL